MPINNRILDNGIRLITEPIAATEAAAIGFWFPAGSRDEKTGEYGLTHFTEHMLFKGTRDLSAYDIARFFDRIGGYFNAFTEREMLCVHCLVPRQYVIEAIDVLSLMIFDSAFRDQDIEKERSVIVSEILSALDDPEETGMELALAAMYPNHPFSRPVAGTVDDVRSPSAGLIRDFGLSFVHGLRPVVAVAGNVDPETVSKRLERIQFGRDAFIAEKSPAPLWNPGVSFPISDFGQSQIFISYPVPTIESATEWYTLSMINAMTGETVSSRLYQSLREEKGLCYSIGSFFLCSRDSGFWTACAAVPPESTVESVAAAERELVRLRSTGFSHEEMKDAKRHICGELALSAEDTENRMKRLARQWFFNGVILTIPEAVKTIETIQDGAIQSMLAETLKESGQSLVVYAGKKYAREAGKRWK